MNTPVLEWKVDNVNLAPVPDVRPPTGPVSVLETSAESSATTPKPSPLIIERYLLRELLTTLFGVGLVLLLIFISGQFVALLREAANEAMPGRAIAQLLLLKNLANLSLLLPLAMFFSIMLALGRLYKDSEMAALTACGVGPRRIVRVMWGAALVVAVAEAVLTLYIAPWAEARGEKAERILQANAEIRGIAPGRFQEIGDRRGVFYTQSLAADGRVMERVFVQGAQDEEDLVVAAARAYQYTDAESGDRYLMFEDGYRYQGTPGQEGYTVMEFERHAVRLQERAPNLGGLPSDSRPTSELVRSGARADLAELQWRISLPIMSLVLALIAVPLSRSSPRQGRYAKFFSGLLVYVVYNNLLSVARAAVERGSLAPALGLWWVHGLMLAFVGWLLVRQYGLRYLLSRLRGAAPAEAPS